MEFDNFIKEIGIDARLINLDEFKGNNRKLFELKKKNPDLPLIFEDTWKTKQDIVKSILSVKKNKNIKKYYARKLTIKEIKSVELIKSFLNDNHLQGFCKSSVKIGLFDNNELVQIMTFGKSRFSKNAKYELLRLATKKYSTVVGGTQRLFKYFILKYGNPSVVSYDDEMIFNGNIYSKLGFFLKSRDTLGYYYYNDKNKTRINRTFFQKSKLSSLFENVDLSLTEEEICEKNGYHKIYDCGQAVWLYNSIKTERDKIHENIEKRWGLVWLDPSEKINRSIYYSFKCIKCGSIFKQKIRFDRNLSCPNCHPINHGSSKGECELYDILSTSGLKIIHNDRLILDGKEIDIYFPDLKLGIEYDGNYWHSDDEKKEKDDKCLLKGITLIHINDEEFVKNEDKVVEYISNFINKNYCEFKIDLNKINPTNRTSGKNRKIICLNDGKIYNNAFEVMGEYNLKNIYDIYNCCNGSLNNYGGYSFEYFENQNLNKLIDKKYNYHTKHIICVETGEVFESIRELEKLGIKTIFDCVSGRQKTAHNLHWKYTEKEAGPTDKTQKMLESKIICVETKKEYNNIAEAQKSTGIFGIEAVINGRRETAGSFHWIKS